MHSGRGGLVFNPCQIAYNLSSQPQTNPQAKKLLKSTPKAMGNSFSKQMCWNINPQANFTQILKQSPFLVSPQAQYGK